MISPTPDRTAELLVIALAGVQRVITPWAVAIFGSRARGDHAPDSDLDLLIITEAATSDPWTLAADIRREIGEIGVGVDIIVTDRTTWERKRMVVGSLEGMVAREGRLIDLHAA